MIKFIKLKNPDNPNDQTQIEMKTENVTVSDLLEDFKYFLLACGYPVENGDIVFERDEE